MIERRADGTLYSNEFRKLAKAMNQRMVELERRGYKSPAYKAVQAKLESLGIRQKRAAGRRFPETGVFNSYNEFEAFQAAAEQFKNQKTSRIRGYKEYRKNVLKGLQERYNYKAEGLSDDDILEFWEAMPDDEKDRSYASDEEYLITVKYLHDVRTGKIAKESAYTITEIVNKIQESKNVIDALKKLGLDTKEYYAFRYEKLHGMGVL